MFILEGAQAGLSWETILKKRENYKHAFDNFNIQKVAKYDEKKKAENSTTTYTERYDPVNDFMPRYRWPEDTVWGPNYDPVDPFRPADYQRVQVVRDEGSVTKGAF